MEEEYRIKDWTPPWIDNGARLLEIIASLNELEEANYDHWVVFCLLLMYQLDQDIENLKNINLQLRDILGD